MLFQKVFIIDLFLIIQNCPKLFNKILILSFGKFFAYNISRLLNEVLLINSTHLGEADCASLFGSSIALHKTLQIQ
jgi:hypothetical protein